jgi:chromosome segregation ATPase
MLNIKNSEIERIKEELNDLKYEIEKEKNRKKNEKEFEKKEDDKYNNDKIIKLNEKNDNLDIINSNLNEALTKLQKENYIINEKYLELRGNIEGLKIDKSGLSKKVIFYENKMKEQEDRINNLEKELKDMKILNRNYEQIIADKDLNLNFSKMNNNSFLANNKLNEEINEMKIKYEKDLSKIKKEYNKILEDKTNDFNVEINEYKNKIEDYELRLKDKENAVSLYKSHIDEQNKKTNDEINMLKIEVNDKAKELSSKNSLYQDQIAAVTLYKNEAEKLKEKNDFLNEKILLIQSDCLKKIDEEKIKNNKLSEKVMKYEEIEGELAKLLNEKKNEIIDKNNEKYFKNLGNKKYN